MDKYTIGQAAAKSGLSPKMIRDYEQKGILPSRPRTQAGYRLYDQNDIDMLCFTARARRLDFSLNQIRSLLLLWLDQDRSSADVKKVAEQHINDLEGKAQQLLDMARYLRQLSQSCAGDDSPECPILKGMGAPFK